MVKRVYITTAIPYVNDTPHIGHALEIVQSDTLARSYRLLRHDTYFLWGSDENAIKNVEAADKKGVTTQELVDKNSALFLDLKKTLNLTFDQFIRTTSDQHKKGAQKLWQLCKKDIYKKIYKGLYCTGCETFYKDGEFENNICPIHNGKLELVEEENYFFSLSKYQNQLQNLIQKDQIKIYPDFRKKEVLNFITKSLEDFSVSRPRERAKGWGVQVPDDNSQIVYVWFDALTNYITALDFYKDGDLFKKYWLENPNRFHVIGKDIVKFHSIYWPAMLLSAGLPIPTKIFVHGFINVEGKKMSKTLGNVIDPFDLVKHYGADAVRYYLLREIPPFYDGDYSDSRMQEIYNADLANELGNLVQRITTLAEKDEILADEKNGKIVAHTYVNLVKSFQFNKALEYIWSLIKSLNRKTDDFAPWQKSKKERASFLLETLKELYQIGVSLLPFLPETAGKIIESTQGKIKKAPVLFPKYAKIIKQV